MSKPFFYRIEAGALIDFATDEEGQGITLLRFAKELQKGQSDIAFIQGIIDEARNYITMKQELGRKGGLARSSTAQVKSSRAKAELKLSQAELKLSQASSSNSNNKDLYKENILLTKDEFNSLITKHGSQFVEKCLEKLSNYKLASGKKYKSDYGAINTWVVDEVKKTHRTDNEVIF